MADVLASTFVRINLWLRMLIILLEILMKSLKTSNRVAIFSRLQTNTLSFSHEKENQTKFTIRLSCKRIHAYFCNCSIQVTKIILNIKFFSQRILINFNFQVVNKLRHFHLTNMSQNFFIIQVSLYVPPLTLIVTNALGQVYFRKHRTKKFE